MHHSILLLGSIILISCLLLNCPASAQEKLDHGTGFWVTIPNPDQKDSLTVSESRQFIDLFQIKSLPIHSIQLPDHKTKEIITWEGVYLREVIQKFGNIDWETMDQLIIKAPDGYSSVISGMRVKQAESALCTFAMQGRKWLDKFGYMRIVFPDLHEMYWVNNPAEIEIEFKKKLIESNNWRFQFFDSQAFDSLRENKRDGKSDPFINDILTQIGCANKNFTVFTKDGHLREYVFDSMSQKMKIAADSTGLWAVRGLGVPIGFRLRNIFFLCSENVGLFARALSSEEQQVWHELFASIHPLVSKGIPIAQITLLLASGEKMPSKKFEDYLSNKISLYQLLELEKDERSDLLEIEINW